MLNALKVFNFEIVFVTERCMDGTVERMRKYGKFGVKLLRRIGRNGQTAIPNLYRSSILKQKGNLMRA
jgi:hypothetical protein